ncbi:hypothetical protein OIV83_001344 [Microbotryomycetes sp. JL201]|nr:hypothetical protein OIV83_001344 [Microbotryomycetes sp. JL201]
MPSILAPSELNTLADLYESGKLQQAPEKYYTPNEDHNGKVSLWQGDITKLAVDAILNAANKSLLGGGGVDGAIHRAAGPDLKKECQTLNGAETGQVKMTKGYNLPAKYVLHAVGPVYSGKKAGENEKMLRSCYSGALELVREAGLRSVALCSISTGVYGYPKDEATPIALDEVRAFLDKHGRDVDHVIFCVFSAEDVEIYEEHLARFFPPASTPPRPLAQPSSSQRLSDMESTPPESDDPSARRNSTDEAVTTAQADPSSMTDETRDGQTVALPKALGHIKRGLAREEVGPEETVRGEVAKGETAADA